MNAGDLRHRVTIQQATNIDNGAGDVVVSAWADVATVWAEVRPTSARERLAQQQVTQEVTHLVSMRWTPAIAKDRRLKFGTRIFNIGGIINVDERNIELRLLCSEET